MCCTGHYLTLTLIKTVACPQEIKKMTCLTSSRAAQGAYLEVEYIRNVLSVSGTLKYADSGTA